MERAAAEALLRAERTRRPIEPLGEAHPELTVERAYAIQLAGRRLRLEGGRRLAGRKVALTSAEAQAAFGAGAPVFGHLLDDMLLADGAAVAYDRFVAPRVEVELAFLIGRPLAGPDVTADEVLAAAEAVAPALEIVDSRIAGWRIGLADLVADNAAGAAAAIGGWVPIARAGDLAALELTMRAGDRTAGGPGAAVLGNPAQAVAWAARALAAHGERIEAGEVVLPGAVAAALPLAAGDVVEASCPAVGAVRVAVV